MLGDGFEAAVGGVQVSSGAGCGSEAGAGGKGAPHWLAKCPYSPAKLTACLLQWHVAKCFLASASVAIWLSGLKQLKFWVSVHWPF